MNAEDMGERGYGSEGGPRWLDGCARLGFFLDAARVL